MELYIDSSHSGFGEDRLSLRELDSHVDLVRGMNRARNGGDVRFLPPPSFFPKVLGRGKRNPFYLFSLGSGAVEKCCVVQVCKRPLTARARCNGQKRPNRANKLSPRGSGRSFGCGRGYSRYGSTLWFLHPLKASDIRAYGTT